MLYCRAIQKTFLTGNLSIEAVFLTNQRTNAVPCLLDVVTTTKSTDIQPTVLVSFSPFSVFAVLNRPTCVSGKTLSSHTMRTRERTLNAQTTQNGTVIFFVFGERREFCLPVSPYSPNFTLLLSHSAENRIDRVEALSAK